MNSIEFWISAWFALFVILVILTVLFFRSQKKVELLKDTISAAYKEEKSSAEWCEIAAYHAKEVVDSDRLIKELKQETVTSARILASINSSLKKHWNIQRDLTGDEAIRLINKMVPVHDPLS